MENQKQEIYGLLPQELEEILPSLGIGGFKVGEVLKWLYEKKISSPQQMTTLSKNERSLVQNNFSFHSLKIKRERVSPDGTQKILYELEDGKYVESVLIPRGRRLTLCMSTQVGCPVGCIFCASGMAGLKRNLRTSEMVGQFLESAKRARQPLTNLVIMGMGEAFLNFQNTFRALQIIHHPQGLAFGIRRTTLSTVGLKKLVEKIFTAPIHPRLAISLHAPTDELRQELIPFPSILSIDEMLDFLERYTAQKLSRVTLEYVLIQGKNSSPQLARLLGKRFSHLPLRINLIPLNPVEGLSHKSPSSLEVEKFCSVLQKQGVKATIRQRHGDAISAACGQLHLREERKKSP